MCALAALVSGEQHPLLTVIAEHSVALLTVIRAMVEDIDDGGPANRRRPPGGPEAASRHRRAPAAISTSRSRSRSDRLSCGRIDTRG